MRNFLILVFGLMLFFLLGYFCIYDNHATLIQGDIENRSNAQLRNIVPDADVQTIIDGRDIRLVGDVATGASKIKAVKTANVWGARVLDNQLVVLDSNKVEAFSSETIVGSVLVKEVPRTLVTDGSPYRFIATLLASDTSNTKEVILKGDVADIEMHERIITFAKEQFTAASVTDGLVEVSDSPKEWETMIEAGISNLALFESGSMEIVDNIMSMMGKVETVEIQNKIRSNVNDQISSGHYAIFNITVVGDNNNVDKSYFGTHNKAENMSDNHGLALNKQEGIECQQQFQQLLAEDAIQFRFSRAQISANSFDLLNKLVKVAHVCPKHEILITGHTDSIGSASVNQQLSEIRAEAVLQFLVQKGINKNRLQAFGYGEDKPIAENTTTSGRAANRRIEFIVKVDEVE